MYYNYWNAFIDEWRNNYTSINCQSCEKGILGWTNPNSIPLFNNQTYNDLSIHYLPEPYWGNTGYNPLEVVMINYNPSEAYLMQSHKHVTFEPNYLSYTFYKNFVFAEAMKFETNQQQCFNLTNAWHWRNRTKPILDALGVMYEDKSKPLVNYLGIELIPWHTVNFGTNESKYMYDNLHNVYKRSILFAANESTRIKNDRLVNTVIVRATSRLSKRPSSRPSNNFRELLIHLNDREVIDNFSTVPLRQPQLAQYHADGDCYSIIGISTNHFFQVFEIDDINARFFPSEPNGKIRFLCIWQQGSNNLPNSNILSQIFNCF